MRDDYDRLDDPRETPALRELLAQSFNWKPHYWERFTRALRPEQVRVLRREGELIAGLALYPFGQFLGGRSQPATGLAAVGVRPESRRQGAALALLRGALEELRAQGVGLSLLYASSSRLYRKAGYSEAGSSRVYRLPLAALDGLNPERELPLVRVEVHEDLELPAAIRAVYGQAARQGAGLLERSPMMWRRVLKTLDPDQRVRAYVIGSLERPRGYVIYTHAPGEGWRYGLEIHDWFALDGPAARRLWTFCADHRSMGDAVTWKGPPVDPMAALLPEPGEVELVGGLPWLLRVVDVGAALSRRGYPSGLDLELQLRIDDWFLPENGGRWVLRVRDGQGEATPGGEGELELDVRALAPLLTGWLTPQQLAATSRLSGPARAMASATQLFAGPSPWMPDRF